MRPLHLFTSTVALALVGLPGSANAEEIHVAGAADLIAGVEGGGSGYAAGVRRTRTTLRLGAEGFIDDEPKHALGVGALIELEPRASFGADVRYLLRFRDEMVLQAGAVAILAPENLLGVSFGYAYRLRVGRGVEVNLNPLVNVFFLGGDLPKDTAIWQATLSAGARIDLF
ncbi:MAG: hypothetical protein FJ096_12630 [Deltaproteobacteria bacterium]|nr:hypothetical protein [Deltaproteobacteria bacterium]